MEAAPQGLRWMTRLGEFLRTRAELLPSPFPSPDRDQAGERMFEAGRSLTPPPPAMLQGFLGSNMFSNEPPSSSSGVPTEVIQEEVQRQLRGVYERLEYSEARNHQLQAQLEAYKQMHEQQAAAAHMQASGVLECSATALPSPVQPSRQSQAGTNIPISGHGYREGTPNVSREGLYQGAIPAGESNRTPQQSLIRSLLTRAGLGIPQRATSAIGDVGVPQGSTLAPGLGEPPRVTSGIGEVGIMQRNTIREPLPQRAPGLGDSQGDTSGVRDLGVPQGHTSSGPCPQALGAGMLAAGNSHGFSSHVQGQGFPKGPDIVMGAARKLVQQENQSGASGIGNPKEPHPGIGEPQGNTLYAAPHSSSGLGRVAGDGNPPGNFLRYL